MLLKLVYRWYERRLEAEVRRGALPRHVGVLPDGNRRFARSAMKSADDGHRTGADTIARLMQWCDELEIPVVTLWVLSTDNFQRPAEELAGIFRLVEERIDSLAEAQAQSARPRRIRSVGRRHLVPPSTLEAIERVERETAHHTGGELIVAVGYGGREEIVDAVRRLLADRISRGDSLEGVASGLDADEIADYSLRPRRARPGPGHPHLGRASALGLHAVAECVQRVLLLRRVLAGVPAHRLLAGASLVRSAPTTPRPLVGGGHQP